MSAVDKVINIITAPTKVFEFTKEKKDWVFSLIMILLVCVLFSFLRLPVTIPAQIESISSNPELNMEEKNAMIESIQGPAVYISGAVILIMNIIITYIIMSGVLLLIRFVFGGEKTVFENMFSAVCYAGIIFALSYIVSTLIIVATNSTQGGLTLGRFFSGLEGYWGIFLNSIDVFALWQTVLYGLILSVYYKYSKAKSMAISFGIYLGIRFLFSYFSWVASMA